MALADPRASTDDLRAAAVVVREATERADRLVDSLLLLARSDRLSFDGLPVTERVELSALAAAGLSAVHDEVRDRRLTVDVALGRRAGARRPRAARAPGRQPGRERRAAQRRRRQRARPRPAAAAAGPGWSSPTPASRSRPDEVESLFEPFRRHGTARTARRGAGLGLSIVRAVTRVHGGRSPPSRGPTAACAAGRPAAPRRRRPAAVTAHPAVTRGAPGAGRTSRSVRRRASPARRTPAGPAAAATARCRRAPRRVTSRTPGCCCTQSQQRAGPPRCPSPARGRRGEPVADLDDARRRPAARTSRVADHLRRRRRRARCRHASGGAVLGQRRAARRRCRRAASRRRPAAAARRAARPAVRAGPRLRRARGAPGRVAHRGGPASRPACRPEGGVSTAGRAASSGPASAAGGGGAGQRSGQALRDQADLPGAGAAGASARHARASRRRVRRLPGQPAHRLGLDEVLRRHRDAPRPEPVTKARPGPAGGPRPGRARPSGSARGGPSPAGSGTGSAALRERGGLGERAEPGVDLPRGRRGPEDRQRGQVLPARRLGERPRPRAQSRAGCGRARCRGGGRSRPGPPTARGRRRAGGGCAAGAGRRCGARARLPGRRRRREPDRLELLVRPVELALRDELGLERVAQLDEHLDVERGVDQPRPPAAGGWTSRPPSGPSPGPARARSPPSRRGRPARTRPAVRRARCRTASSAAARPRPGTTRSWLAACSTHSTPSSASDSEDRSGQAIGSMRAVPAPARRSCTR